MAAPWPGGAGALHPGPRPMSENAPSALPAQRAGVQLRATPAPQRLGPGPRGGAEHSTCFPPAPPRSLCHQPLPVPRGRHHRCTVHLLHGGWGVLHAEGACAHVWAAIPIAPAASPAFLPSSPLCLLECGLLPWWSRGPSPSSLCPQAHPQTGHAVLRTAHLLLHREVRSGQPLSCMAAVSLQEASQWLLLMPRCPRVTICSSQFCGI